MAPDLSLVTVWKDVNIRPLWTTPPATHNMDRSKRTQKPMGRTKKTHKWAVEEWFWQIKTNGVTLFEYGCDISLSHFLQQLVAIKPNYSSNPLQAWFWNSPQSPPGGTAACLWGHHWGSVSSSAPTHFHSPAVRSPLVSPGEHRSGTVLAGHIMQVTQLIHTKTQALEGHRLMNFSWKYFGIFHIYKLVQ